MGNRRGGELRCGYWQCMLAIHSFPFVSSNWSKMVYNVVGHSLVWWLPSAAYIYLVDYGTLCQYGTRNAQHNRISTIHAEMEICLRFIRLYVSKCVLWMWRELTNILYYHLCPGCLLSVHTSISHLYSHICLWMHHCDSHTYTLGRTIFFAFSLNLNCFLPNVSYKIHGTFAVHTRAPGIQMFLCNVGMYSYVCKCVYMPCCRCLLAKEGRGSESEENSFTRMWDRACKNAFFIGVIAVGFVVVAANVNNIRRCYSVQTDTAYILAVTPSRRSIIEYWIRVWSDVRWKKKWKSRNRNSPQRHFSN